MVSGEFYQHHYDFQLPAEFAMPSLSTDNRKESAAAAAQGIVPRSGNWQANTFMTRQMMDGGEGGE